MYESIPDGLRHVLDVSRLVLKTGLPRIKAVREVAKQRRIDQATVASACTRSIGLNTAQVDEFLTPENVRTFCLHLVKRFPAYQEEIEMFFSGIGDEDIQSGNGIDRSLRTMFPEERKRILHSLLLKQVSDKLAQWLNRKDLPHDLRREIEELQIQIEGT